jgi:hypothetical protein
MTPNRSDAPADPKIRADQHRLKAISDQLANIANTTPSPELKRIATNAQKEIRL